jgi:hypothetical protein
VKLRQIRLHTFRQFAERIDFDPVATASVGRNDSGKTGFLVRLIDQQFFEQAAQGSNQSKVPGPAGGSISFDTVWDVAREDYRDFPLEAAFRRKDVLRLGEKRCRLSLYQLTTTEPRSTIPSSKVASNGRQSSRGSVIDANRD